MGHVPGIEMCSWVMSQLPLEDWQQTVDRTQMASSFPCIHAASGSVS
jgi:hypothetical protein